MQLHILASGSTGNAVFLEIDGTRFLIDAGISARRIQRGLQAVGVEPTDINAVLVTHEHVDHVNGLPVLTRKYGLPVYTRRKTWDNFQPTHWVESEYRHVLGDELEVGRVRVEPFSISHDAADPVGFAFYGSSVKCIVATDLGCVSERVESVIAGADVMVFESNHDLGMLNVGPYPYPLKQRILSNKGHLSNSDTGRCLARMERKRGMHVFLAHLSRHNNHPDLALATVSQLLDKQGCAVGSDLYLHVTKPDATVSFQY